MSAGALCLLAVLGAVASPAAAAPAGGALTLDDALALAGRQNKDLRLSRSRREAAGVDVTASWAGVLPRLDLSASGGRDFVGARQSVQVVPTGVGPDGLPTFQQQAINIPATDFADWSLGLKLSQPIFDGLRSWNAIRRAESMERASAGQLDEAALTTAFDVTRKFYEVVKAERSLAVLEETVARSEELVRRADALFAEGRGLKGDAYAARVNLANDRINVESQRARVAQARSDLAVALGGEGVDVPAVVAPAAVDAPGLGGAAEPPPAEALLARARAARPLLRSQRELVAASGLDVAIARADWWPALSLQAAYNREGPSLTGSEGVLGDPTRQYTAVAQVALTWNLFAGRQTQAQVAKAGIAEAQARIGAEQADQQVASEIARARSALVALSRSALLAAESLGSAEENVKLARARLDAGAASQLEVRDALLKLTQAKLTLLQARVDEAVARADLNRAVGGVL
ncbi:TolC family protein [Anaeromyxobacter paludicola]|uniref:Outer membrane efflux protein n=1 Tax=Anaeromyxobacter paludicola TaxID=2918171 RepID=A0ABN6ND60_9BACT|nr:TolC family protein [Anaeromyxobacter paludicola]BDG09937.1 hypothetical protein AMPC_30500 [Anaeromyxobacter paludicola]